MKFTVKSGKYNKSIEAIDFNHAAQRFLEMLFSEDDSPRLGSVISVACEVTESFVLTNEALTSLTADKRMQLYKGTENGESRPD
jgi:hypothetical protein